ncbi:MAG TPA: metal ABC transporter ATP-binding protein [Kineosporiaceae bacterium]|nr:metal ABC transporter ATP-binding protein [Kineosporiaceae bacterium]
MSDGDPVVRFARAAVTVAGRTVWSGVDVVVRPGEFVAVLGPNGGGKSTMIKAILGLIPLSAGTLTVLGGPPRARNSSIGYVPQRRSFDSEVRIRGVDLVRLGLTGARWGAPLPGARRFSARARAEAHRVEKVIELVGASRYAGRPIGELSGGEQQRLLIAEALAARPRLLLLDEPLESLDLPNQAAVAALVAKIGRAEDVAVVMVAHDINPILGYVDEVIYLAGGHAAEGPPHEVITDATLSQLYGTPVEVLATSTGRLVVVGATEEASYSDHRHHP